MHRNNNMTFNIVMLMFALYVILKLSFIEIVHILPNVFKVVRCRFIVCGKGLKMISIVYGYNISHSSVVESF